jgi:prophage antirepressor-like protein
MGSQEITVFKFEGEKSVRTVEIDGEPWFMAKDVCEILVIENARQAIQDFPKNEKGVSTIYTLRGKQEMNIINEPGVYRLIFQSRKPQAEAFKTWIFNVVLPAIRKTGAYALPEFKKQTEARLQDIEARQLKIESALSTDAAIRMGELKKFLDGEVVVTGQKYDKIEFFRLYALYDSKAYPDRIPARAFASAVSLADPRITCKGQVFRNICWKEQPGRMVILSGAGVKA